MGILGYFLGNALGIFQEYFRNILKIPRESLWNAFEIL